MRTNLIILCVLLSVNTTSAQQVLPKGALLLGGDLGAGFNRVSRSDRTEKAFRGYLSPSIGWARKNNRFHGFFASAAYSEIPDYLTLVPNAIYRDFNFGFFIRNYKSIGKNFYLFLQQNIAAGYYSNTTYYGFGPYFATREKRGQVNLTLTPGLSYKLTNRLHIETGFRDLAGARIYTGTIKDMQPGSNDIKSSGADLYASLNNFNSQLYLGFRLLLEDGRLFSK